MTFKCDVHEFTTDEPAKFREHKQQQAHEYHGIAPCENCATEVKFSKTVKLAPTRAAPVIFCEECKKDV